MKKPVATLLAVALLGAMTLGAVASSASVRHKPAQNIVQTAAGRRILQDTSLARQARWPRRRPLGIPEATVFAPPMPRSRRSPRRPSPALAKNKAKLRAVLLYHVVAGKLTAAQVVKHKSLTTLEGGKVAIRTRNGNVYVNRARVIKANVLASNGVIHVINRVLIPAG